MKLLIPKLTFIRIYRHIFIANKENKILKKKKKKMLKNLLCKLKFTHQ